MTNTLLTGNAAAALFNRRTALRFATITAAGVAAMTLPGLGANAFADTASAGTTSAGTTSAGTASADAVSQDTESLPQTVGAKSAGGYIKPNKDNTGVKAGSKLTVHKGDIIVTKAGTVIENMDIFGFIKIRAANVVIRNCQVRGSGPASSNTGLIDCNHSAVRNALIEDCLLVPDFPSVWLDGVIGKEYTARRCNVYRTVDGFGVYNVSDKKAPTNVTIESCFIHDLAYFAKDPNHSNGPTHNDAIQIQGGANINIRGNNIMGFLSTNVGSQNYADRRWNQGILVQPNVAPITNSDISYNWFDGCKVHIFFSTTGKNPKPLRSVHRQPVRHQPVRLRRREVVLPAAGQEGHHLHQLTEQQRLGHHRYPVQGEHHRRHPLRVTNPAPAPAPEPTTASALTGRGGSSV